jgi:hypothetical protein
MEGVHHQPEGDRNEITSEPISGGQDRPQHQDHPDQQEKIIYEAPAEELPTTFAEAKQRNAYTLLRELYDHGMTVDIKGERRSDPRHDLAGLALSAAVVAWWSRWQPIMMHRALKAGASLSEVAAAAGVPETEVRERWSAWAEQQTQVVIGDWHGLDPVEAETVRQHIERKATGDASSLPDGPER